MTKSIVRSDYRVLFVGYLFPDDLESIIVDQPNPPIQTQRFGLALLDALLQGFGNCVDVLSLAPLMDFPRCKRVFAPRAKWTIPSDVQATMVSFVNILGLKHLTRFIGIFFFVMAWTLRNRRKKRVIVMHGVSSCTIWGILFGQKLAPVSIVPFLTDNLGIPQKHEGLFVKWLRRIDVKLMDLGLKKVSGVVAMTPWLAEILAPSRPALVIRAIHNSFAFSFAFKDEIYDPTAFTVVYAGGLYYDSGITLLLDAFEQAKHPQWRLVIAGVGELINIVKEFARRDAQIEYLGFVNFQQLTELYEQSSVLVVPRLLSSRVMMSFPSKIVEYLGTGKPVISTCLPVFDDAFRKHLILASDETAEEMARCLLDVASWDASKRRQWRERATAFVQQELSPSVQGQKIFEFIEQL